MRLFTHCALLGCFALLWQACASYENMLPRTGHALESIKEAYLAVCSINENKQECVAARNAINDAIDAYTEVNDAVGDK